MASDACLEMNVDQKLLARARRAPGDLWFEDADRLARQLGFELVGGAGSHLVYHHPRGHELRQRFPRPLNLQRGANGKAKAYQVRQLLEMAQALALVPEPPER